MRQIEFFFDLDAVRAVVLEDRVGDELRRTLGRPKADSPPFEQSHVGVREWTLGVRRIVLRVEAAPHQYVDLLVVQSDQAAHALHRNRNG